MEITAILGPKRSMRDRMHVPSIVALEFDAEALPIRFVEEESGLNNAGVRVSRGRDPVDAANTLTLMEHGNLVHGSAQVLQYDLLIVGQWPSLTVTRAPPPDDLSGDA
ncbi:MAG: hypothetical protein ACJATT_002704 [Myxococcota bacterium]